MSLHKNTGITESVLDLIGNTPLLRLKVVTAGLEGNVLLKLENENPSGSIKDRMALHIIENAEKSGRIKPGVTKLIEASSGNTAQAVAFIAAVKGYKVLIRLPESTAVPEKIKTLQRYGAEIELMKAGEQAEEANKLAKQAGLHGATTEIPGRLKCLKEEETDPNVYWLRQFSNPSNLEGQAVIGKEILEQTQGKVDVFIASVGTGGTFLGVSQVLKAALPNVRCIAIQPLGWKGGMDPLAADAKYVPGITGGLLKEIRDSGIADQVITLPSDEAVDMAFRLSREEGLNCGMSTGANVLIALREASKPGMRGKNVVTIMVDGGYRYISLEKYVT